MYTFKITTFAALIVLATSCGQKDVTIKESLTVPVTVRQLKPTTIASIVNSTGTILPKGSVTITSEMAGKYFLQKNSRTGELYKMGDLVNKGDIIVKFQDAEYENGIKIESIKLNLDITKQEFDKQQSLYDKGGVTLREVKNAEVSYINAKYAYENAKLNLDKMVVVAPISGAITQLPYYTQGTDVEAKQPMFQIMDNKMLYLEVSLPEKYYNTVYNGYEVYLTNYTLPEDTLTGEITQIAPAIDATSRTFKAIVEVKNKKQLFLPGMFVKADIVLEKKTDALVVPKEILSGRGNSFNVFVVEDGEAKERRVHTGIEQDNKVEIIDGLSVEDRLVIKGYETLKDKAKVRVLEESKNEN